MTTNRLLFLLLFLLVGMSTVFFLPPAPPTQPVGVDLRLPPLVGPWYGKDIEISEKERAALGEDTTFARKSYRTDVGHELWASVVLAGHDMNTSIHRPERCLPAQGWTIVDREANGVPIGANTTLRVMRLRNVHPFKGSDGQMHNLYNLNYYWFVGHTDTTPSHWKRTLIDIKDRLLHGYSQRWAYVTVAAIITEGVAPNGQTEAEVDETIRRFIRQLVPKLHKDSVQL